MLQLVYFFLTNMILYFMWKFHGKCTFLSVSISYYLIKEKKGDSRSMDVIHYLKCIMVLFFKKIFTKIMIICGICIRKIKIIIEEYSKSFECIVFRNIIIRIGYLHESAFNYFSIQRKDKIPLERASSKKYE